MLTKDENIVDVRLAVQYQVSDAKKYLFNVQNQTATLKQVTESAERADCSIILAAAPRALGTTSLE
jgi:regulator of protease activity HflC (stomatin/prohibitin superfamily)